MCLDWLQLQQPHTKLQLMHLRTGRTLCSLVKHQAPPCKPAHDAAQENGNWGVDQQPSSSMNSGSFHCSANQGGGFSVSAQAPALHHVYATCSTHVSLAGRLTHACVLVRLCMPVPQSNVTSVAVHPGPLTLRLVLQDPRTNNPTYQIFYPSNETLSTPLVLTILMESNPVNTYPFAIVLPTGSTLIIAGRLQPSPGPLRRRRCCPTLPIVSC